MLTNHQEFYPSLINKNFKINEKIEVKIPLKSSAIKQKTQLKIMKLRSGFHTTTLQSLLEEAKKELLSFKRIPSKNPAKDGSRANVLPEGQERIQAFTLGKVRAYHQKKMMNSSNNRTLKYKKIHLLLDQIIKKFNPNFKYTTIQINRNVKCPKHRDRNNVGASVALGLGNYTGGGINQYEKDGSITYLENNGKLVYQDGSLEHQTADWVGERYAIIFFYHKGSLEENGDSRASIELSLGLRNELPPLSYKIVIPSYKRANSKYFKTIKYLKSVGIPKESIFLFVNETEYADYQIHSEDANIISAPIKNGPGGIVRIHNYITEYFAEGEKLLCMDDDLFAVYECLTLAEGKFGKKKLGKKAFKKFVKDHFELLLNNSLSLCGLYPVDNAMFMANQKKFNFGNCWVYGVCYFTINKREVILTEECWCKEEIERSILHYPSVRSNKYCYRTTYYAKGGINATGRNDEIEKKCAEKLFEMYPNNIKNLYQRPNGKTDLKLKKITIERTLKENC